LTKETLIMGIAEALGLLLKALVFALIGVLMAVGKALSDRFAAGI
jgi:hypothetical protein